ncbi:MAG: hypothetical protein AAB316_03115 [Bacteroidota bacterium]
MKNIQLWLLCATVFAACLLNPGCKKDPASSKKSLLTSVECWHLTKIEFLDSTTNVWEDFFLDECLTENCYSYRTDDVFVWDNEGMPCDSSEPQTIEATWHLSSDGKTLTWSVGSDKETYTIAELSENRLVLESEVTDFGDYMREREVFEPK